MCSLSIVVTMLIAQHFKDKFVSISYSPPSLEYIYIYVLGHCRYLLPVQGTSYRGPCTRCCESHAEPSDYFFGESIGPAA